jgi:glycosyltransferase involved in cell wall biosynthesis
MQFRASVDAEIEFTPSPFLDARRDGMDVQMYGMFHDLSSIPNVCRQLAHALKRTGLRLGIHSYLRIPFQAEGLEANRGIDSGAPIGFFYGVPDSVREPVWQHPTRVMGLACETDRVPDRWAQCCNEFHLVIVPSRFCHRALVDSGVKAPILIVPHGLEDCYRPASTKQRSTPFVFYNVVNPDRPRRKGLRELLVAFQCAFAERNDVVLRLRTQRSAKVLREFSRAGVPDRGVRIQIDERPDLPTVEFAAAYSDVHCTVHPSHAEGFGLIPLQSIACETPVIAPAATGLADFLEPDNAIVLRTQGRTSIPDVYYRSGTHPLVDEDHLTECLRYAEANWELEYQKVRRIGARHRERFAWRSVLAPFCELIASALEVSDAGERNHLLAAAARP